MTRIGAPQAQRSKLTSNTWSRPDDPSGSMQFQPLPGAIFDGGDVAFRAVVWSPSTAAGWR